MAKEIEIPEGYEASIEGNKVIIELMESEDERIRKALRDIVRDMPYMETELRAYGLTVEKTVAYLEKQKEQKPADVSEKIEELCSNYPLNKDVISEQELSAYHQGLTFGATKIAEYLGVQKLIPKFKVGDRIYDKRDSYNRNVIREVGKDYYINAFAQKMDMVYTDANFEFLEHLDNDLIDSKPAEWSEDDEKYLNLAINIVASDFGEDSPLVPWLKCIKYKMQPQPHWKPSEGHMKALSYVKDYFKDVLSAKKEYVFLVQLYDDLQKLL